MGFAWGARRAAILALLGAGCTAPGADALEERAATPEAASPFSAELTPAALRDRFAVPSKRRNPRAPSAPTRRSPFDASGAAQAVRRGAVIEADVGAGAASLRLGVRADQGFSLRTPSASIVAGRLLGALPVEGVVADGLVLYPEALGPGADVVHRPVRGGTEDFVIFGRAPAEPRVTYEVDVSAAAGLRVVGGALELLDGRGAPRARVRAPAIVEEARDGQPGRSLPVTLEVIDCAVDRDPRAPWGRPVVPPGRDVCQVALSWSEDVRYPAALDPSWTTAEDPIENLDGNFTLTTLASGLVLLAGGPYPDATLCELFDPATLTWAATGSMTGEHNYPEAVRLLDGRVAVVDGGVAVDQGIDLYDPDTGTWAAGAPLEVRRFSFSLDLLPDGRVLAAGGDEGDVSVSIDSAEIYDPVGDTWALTDPLAGPRNYHRTARLADGRILLTGGMDAIVDQVTAEIFDPDTETWSAAAPMQHERSAHVAVTLADGRVLAAVGWSWASGEIYDPVADTWTFTGAPIDWNSEGAAGLLPSGAVLINGGYDFSEPTQKAQLFDPATGLFVPTTPMEFERLGHRMVQLEDGRMLVVGGYFSGDGAEIYEPDVDGTACFFGAECGTGHCVEGVCCDTACEGPCEACTAAQKGGGDDGTCEPVALGTDPKGGCGTEAPTTCGSTGTCDGAGACAVYAEGTLCGAPACDESESVTSACDGAGTCVEETVACAPFTCAGAGCGTSCNSDRGCDPTGFCDEAGVCAADLAEGEACERPAQCASDRCAGGSCSALSACVDEATYVTPGGELVDCAPFACGVSGCFEACSSLLECARPNVCRGDGTCGAPSSPPVATGCAVGVPRAPGFGAGGLAAIALLVGAAAARRRGREPS